MNQDTERVRPRRAATDPASPYSKWDQAAKAVGSQLLARAVWAAVELVADWLS